MTGTAISLQITTVLAMEKGELNLVHCAVFSVYVITAICPDKQNIVCYATWGM